MPERDHLVVPATDNHVTATEPTWSEPGSGRGPTQHQVRTRAGLVSLSWEPDQGAFVAARGRQTWSDARLGALARTVGMNVPADVARQLRRDERLQPGPTAQLRPAYAEPLSAHRLETAAEPLAPEGPADVPDAPSVPEDPVDAPPALQDPANARPEPEDPANEDAPAWPPAGTYVVPSRHGDLAIAWDREHRCFAAVAASGECWRAEHVDDLAIKAGAGIPRAYVEDLLHDAGRPLPIWDPPPPEPEAELAQWDPAPLDVPALLDDLPPGVANELRSALAAPSRTEPGGVARVETARRSVRAEWAAWAHEAPARRALIEDLDSVMHGLARGDLLHQAVRRLEGLVERFFRLAEVERSPTLGAHLRARARMAPTPPTPSPVDKLRALRSRPAAPANAVETP